MIKIDKDMPMPSRSATVGQSKYPFAAMQIGESFFCTAPINIVTSAKYAHRPKTFSARTVTENGVKGVRVWRVE